jgi:asparagine synthase (glutamine-hydrolysing)
MCGIVGTNFTYDGDFDKVTALLDNRGPDHRGVFENEGIRLGHTRLSIIDLDHEADQPMSYDGIVIVFNGEIYNYGELIAEHNLKCTTKSDTEVLIRLYQKYGVKFLEFLNGAFSFCIYDSIKKRFFCARDRYGKKPFYYYYKDGKFIFSSMIKPIIKILGFTPKLNRVALSQYLQYFTPLAPNTFYQGIEKLDKASYILYEEDKFEIKRYYKIKTYTSIRDEKTALEKIEELLIDSVGKRFRADVEVGTLLSGGIDSSLISSIYAKQTGNTIHTFSVGYKSETKYSELPFAKLAAKHIKSNHTALEIGQKEYIESLDEIFEALEEPHADPAAIPLFHLTKEIRKQGIKSVLSGEGSDELFLGYDNYAKFLKYYQFAETLDQNQFAFLDDIIGALQTNTKESEYLKRVVKKQTIYNSFGEIYTDTQRKRLLKKVASFKRETPKKDPIEWMSSIDMKIWLGEALLSKVDKICMVNSVENRNPFLDYRLVDTVFAIDSKLKSGDTNKYLLKKIAAKYIPKEIIDRQKKGFNSPFNEWLFKEYGEKLLDDILIVNGQTFLFNEKYIYYIYNEAKQNRFKQHFYALWHFCKWYYNNYLS